jgi:N-acetylmuramoyl-L-alanine amidase
MKLAISSGHGKYVRGAKGLIDEVDEARKVVPGVADALRLMGHDVVTFNDDTSTTQSQNLSTIVNWHNRQDRELDISVHFNAYIPTDGGRGTETLYLTQAGLAGRVSNAIASVSGLINRGSKKRSDLYFLNGTTKPAILLEICFVDAGADVEAYNNHFDDICDAIAGAVAPAAPVADESPMQPGQTLHVTGKVSWFGGPNDTGVSPSEGLAFIYKVETKPEIFLPKQPPGTTGLARRLDPDKFFLALRWDYSQFPKTRLAGKELALVRAPKTGIELNAAPADWGPHTSTGRTADLSLGLLNALRISTDDEVEVTYPTPGPTLTS